MTLLIEHPDCDAHTNPPGHPEQVARLPAIRAALADLALTRERAEPAAPEAVLRCHPQDYLDALAAKAPRDGHAPLDPDTWLSPGTMHAAWLGAGAAVRAVDAVLDGTAPNAFCAMRPPGHHAERATPMGFCYLGNAAIAARHALDAHGLSRVAVVDFDVHHGNGTQDLLWDEARALFVSTHQSPLWPGTGAASEVGPHGNIVNRPLPPGSDGGLVRQVWDRELGPRLDAFAPELVIVSAGFDAHADDPLAQLEWQTDDFAWLTERLCDLARDHADGRVVSCLEGGYDLPALAAGVAAHVDVLRRRGDG